MKKDINKLAKEVTKDNFISESLKLNKCPRHIGLKDSHYWVLQDNNCRECWGKALKDIKFLGDE